MYPSVLDAQYTESRVIPLLPTLPTMRSRSSASSASSAHDSLGCAAVHREPATGDPRGLLRAEEHDHRRNLPGAAHATERQRLPHHVAREVVDVGTRTFGAAGDHAAQPLRHRGPGM